MSNYHIKNLEEYFHVYKKSIQEPEVFWEEIAEEHFTWRKKWTNVLSWDFSKPEIKWFENAKLNIVENCIDRHLPTRGEKTAIIYEPNSPDEDALHISYNELHERVCKFANVLKSNGVEKGDRVIIYLPMIPELAVSVLACARIGAVHSVVFAGFPQQHLVLGSMIVKQKWLLLQMDLIEAKKLLTLKGL